MNDRRIVNILYCERELQKTVSVPSSFTKAEEGAAASKGLLDHLRRLPGVPPTIGLDDKRANTNQACKIPGTKIGDPDASGESTQCSAHSQSLPQSPPQTGQSNPHLTSDRRNASAMYFEEGLQITLSVPSSLPVAVLKAVAFKGMFEHLRDLLGILVTLDDTRCEIHPALPAGWAPDLRIGNICTSDKSIVIAVWPKPTPGSTLMPSPIMDALSSAAAELADTTARLATLESLIEKSEFKRKGSSPTCPPTNVAQDSAPADDGSIVGAFLMTKARISEALMTRYRIMESLDEKRAQLWAKKAKLEAENAKLWTEKAELLKKLDA